MRRLILILMLLLTVASSSAMAEWVRELTPNEGFAAADEYSALSDWFSAEEKNMSSPVRDKSGSTCKAQHEYVEEKLKDNVKLKNLIQAFLTKNCDKDMLLAEARFRLAAQSGSYAALSWLHEQMKKANPSQFVLTKPYPPKIGMTKLQAYESTFGEPQNKEKRTTQNGTNEIWFYGWGGYLVFDVDGLLAVIHE